MSTKKDNHQKNLNLKACTPEGEGDAVRAGLNCGLQRSGFQRRVVMNSQTPNFLNCKG